MMTRQQAERQAVAVARKIAPRKKFCATINGDDILDVSADTNLSRRESEALERAVSRLGWRAWSIDHRGIAFKPTARLPMR